MTVFIPVHEGIYLFFYSLGSDTSKLQKIAYLLDVQSIRILDLCSNISSAPIYHDSKIDWLEVILIETLRFCSRGFALILKRPCKCLTT